MHIAAMHGLYLSDCHFYNFGILLTENATEHLVVIIDAGSRGILRDERWKKSIINNVIIFFLEMVQTGRRNKHHNRENVAGEYH